MQRGENPTKRREREGGSLRGPIKGSGVFFFHSGEMVPVHEERKKRTKEKKAKSYIYLGLPKH